MPAILISGCKKKYSYNKEKYEEIAPYYVERCEKFIRDVKRDKNCDIVFLGDSITEGYPLHLYFNEFHSVNRGINGDTTYGVIDRLEFSVYDLNPKIVYLMIGTNNFWDCTSNYEDILKGIKEHSPTTKVLVMSILPRDGDEAMQQIRENNVKIQKFAENHGYFYVNAFTPMTIDSNNLLVNHNLFVDGVHPNMDG